MDFAKRVNAKGIFTAYLTYAAEEAVLKQNKTLIIGKDAIRTHFENQPSESMNLKWIPEFVDVAK